MANIDRAYVTIGLAWLILGMVQGLYMGATGDLGYLTVHVAMLLGGFVVLTFYGMIYRLWPALKDSALVKAQFWIAVIGSVLIPVGAILIVQDKGVAVAAGGSSLAIIAAVLMLWIFQSRSGEVR
jgi:hypothetical protein